MLGKLRLVVLGGEPINVKDVEKAYLALSTLKIMNHYGPTETTIGAAADLIDVDCLEELKHRPTIGKPISNTQIYIFDRHRNLLPIGVPGEIHIAGTGVAAGYFKQEELTEEKFISNPFSSNDEKMYKTGDIGRFTWDGRIEFIGRRDNQVKIRGFRVELDEICQQLLLYPSIQEAIIIDRDDKNGQKYLCAYFISQESLTVTKLRSYLLEFLPEYMVPAHFVQLEKLPLTANGKVNRKQLPEPESLRPQLETEYIIPNTAIEKVVAEVWKEVLGVEKVGVNDNFFELGGNSLKLIQVSDQLKNVLQREIPFVTLFKYPTISALTHWLIKEGETSVEHPILEKQEQVKSVFVNFNTQDKSNNEIAIIGMAGKFPGAGNINEFWDNLKDGIESITFFSDDELIKAGVSREKLRNPNYIKAKGIMKDCEFFDPHFFEYSPREAQVMDPQLRLLHECSWEALEDAGYSPESYPGLIGVFTGVKANLYWMSQFYTGKNNYAESFGTRTFNSTDFFSTRISYKFNIKGPSFNVQTGCSSSLVAIDLAVQSLLNGKCDMALAGGVSIALPHKTGYLYHEGMIFSADGHCRAFSAGASGTVMGDGAGMVLLKRLEDAQKDGDYIYAVIKGSAVNNDGNDKVGFTAPSVSGQAEVIRAAHQMAGIEPESVTYVETHGTGTSLGDPIEMEGLKLAFHSEKKAFCGIGSVKTNLGHLESAAGAAGLIKTVLALKHRMLPPSLICTGPNPNIGFVNSPFYVNSSLIEWENLNTPLRAGVSSFGIGGTNAHVVLEEAPERKTSFDGRECKMLILSAKSRPALDRMTDNLLVYMRNHPETNLADMAYTLQVGRSGFKYRKMLICSELMEAVELLGDNKQGQVYTATVEESRTMIFMFPGEGVEYINMGRELYEKEVVFKEEVDRCFEILQPLAGNNIKEILYPVLDGEYTDEIHQSWYSQATLFIVEYALGKLLIKWGIQPQVMIGHGIGEYVAACLKGVLSLNDALKLVHERGCQYLSDSVQFIDGLKELVNGDEQVIFVEVGPGKNLSTLVRQPCESESEYQFVHLLKQKEEAVSDLRYLFEGIGKLWLNGITLNWHEFYQDEKRYRIPLPTYPFERQYFSVNPVVKVEDQTRAETATTDEVVLYTRTDAPENYIAPRSRTEEKLVSIMEEMFGINQISVDEDFFDLGGDSLKALNLNARIHKELDVEITLQEVFKYPIIEELATYIDNTRKQTFESIQPLAESEYYPYHRLKNECTF